MKCLQRSDWHPVAPIALSGQLSEQSFLFSRALFPPFKWVAKPPIKAGEDEGQSIRWSSTGPTHNLFVTAKNLFASIKMREIVHLQAGQCGNQIGAKVRTRFWHRRVNRIKVWKSLFEIGRANGLACAVIRLMIAMVRRGFSSAAWMTHTFLSENSFPPPPHFLLVVLGSDQWRTRNRPNRIIWGR